MESFHGSSKNAFDSGFRCISFFVAVMAVCDVWFGLSVLKVKTRNTASRELKHIAPPLALLVLTSGIMITGFLNGSILLMLFPLIGIATARRQLSYWLSAPTRKMHWWYAHMEGMFGACIATVTAFLVTALPRLTGAPFFSSVIFWIAPGFLMGFLLNQWIAKYQRRFEQSGMSS